MKNKNYDIGKYFRLMLNMMFFVVIIGLTTTSVSATLIYYEDFEDGLTTGWVLGSNATLVSDNTISGSYSLQSSTDSTQISYIALPINLSKTGIVNVSFIYRINGAEGDLNIGLIDPNLNQNGFSLICDYGRTNEIPWCDYNGLNTLDLVFTMIAGNEVRVTYLIDYQNSKFQLYLNDTLQLINGDVNATIFGTPTTLNNFYIQGDTGRYGILDNISITYDSTLNVDYVSPTPTNNSVTNNTFVFINTTSTSTEPTILCSLNFDGTYYNMNNAGDTFNYNITTLLNGTYNYQVNCSTPFSTNITESRFITINQTETLCTPDWISDNTACNGNNYTIQYIDLNMCGVNTSLPVDNGTIVNCTIPNAITGLNTFNTTVFTPIVVIFIVIAFITAIMFGFWGSKGTESQALVMKIVGIALVILTLAMIGLALLVFS